jgi:hypothetical protein
MHAPNGLTISITLIIRSLWKKLLLTYVYLQTRLHKNSSTVDMNCNKKREYISLFFLISFFIPLLTLNIKTMDTTTVLQIIKMLDAEIRMNSETIRNDSTIGLETAEAIGNESWGLEKFRDYLQSFIEGQLNGAENQTEQ